MRGKLFLLNVLLLAGIAGAAMELKKLLEETRKREAMVHSSAPALPQAKAVPAAPAVEKTSAANYFDIAARLLLSKDRNPTVIVAPPPVKQIPPFPFAYGVLMISEPPIVMLSPAKGQRQKGYLPGEMIGDFKIAAVGPTSVTFEWDGQTFVKSMEDLADKEASKIQVAAAEAPAQAAPAAPGATTLSSTNAPKEGPGVDVGANLRSCNAGDATAPGTVVDGYKKLVTPTPFGNQCRWEKVQ